MGSHSALYKTFAKMYASPNRISRNGYLQIKDHLLSFQTVSIHDRLLRSATFKICRSKSTTMSVKPTYSLLLLCLHTGRMPYRHDELVQNYKNSRVPKCLNICEALGLSEDRQKMSKLDRCASERRVASHQGQSFARNLLGRREIKISSGG